MRELDHTQLHTIMDSDPHLKKMSEKVHALPPDENFEGAKNQKLQMMEIYAQAANCNSVLTSRMGIEDVFVYLSSQFSSYTEFKRGANQTHFEIIKKIAQRYREEKKCHSPNGNNYVCFCDNS